MNSMTQGQQSTFREITRYAKHPPSHIIGDVTARDGIQAIPWYHVPTKENRAQWAKAMMRAGMQVEIGFPVLEGDPETIAVRHVVEHTRELSGGIFVLARLSEADISMCAQVLEGARYGGIHTFVGTSPEHREALGMTREQIIEAVSLRVEQIRRYGYVAQFSAEDATRTENDFLAEVYQSASQAGAQILNVPDTVGYTDWDDFQEKLAIVSSVAGDSILSVHCHNDLSFGEANPAMAIKHGLAHKVEGTIFGIGERTGNTDLTSLVITLSTHPEYKKYVSRLIQNPRQFARVIELIEAATGYCSRPVQPGYGFDALINRSGVHQAKVAKMKNSYLWVDPEEFGLKDRDTIDVGPLSGKAGVEFLLSELKIPHDETDIIKLTALIRAIFSPDTNIADIERMFPEIPEDKINKLSNEVQAIRREARMLIPTIRNQKQWKQRTHKIVRDAVKYYYGKSE